MACGLLGGLAEFLDNGGGTDLLLDVDGNGRNRQLLPILLILPLPHQLRVQGRVARIQRIIRPILLMNKEIPILNRRIILPLVLVFGVVDAHLYTV